MHDWHARTFNMCDAFALRRIMLSSSFDFDRHIVVIIIIDVISSDRWHQAVNSSQYSTEISMIHRLVISTTTSSCDFNRHIVTLSARPFNRLARTPFHTADAQLFVGHNRHQWIILISAIINTVASKKSHFHCCSYVFPEAWKSVWRTNGAISHPLLNEWLKWFQRNVSNWPDCWALTYASSLLSTLFATWC